MANREDTFSFKQFAVRHGGTAGLKVCTESCWFGAWVALPNQGLLLDAGSGCGLLALMAAQRQPALRVIGIDSNPEAVRLASINFADSPFASRLEATNWDLNHPLGLNEPLAGVICNPPFFVKGLQRAHAGLAQALHTETQPWLAWLAGWRPLLAPEGMVHLLLPHDQMASLLIATPTIGYIPLRLGTLRHRVGGPILRQAISLGLGHAEANLAEDLHVVDQGFGGILEDFYLGT